MTDHFIITVNGTATDIRATSALALRQAKVRKDGNPAAIVEVHYGEAEGAAWLLDGTLTVNITAKTSPQTHLATVHA